MKKKVLLSSVLTIALCLSLIAGSTFALFTSQSTINIAATSGTVKFVAEIKNMQTWSLEDDKTVAGRIDGSFTQGGSAKLEEGKLTLDKIIPGDKVSFDITGVNSSDVMTQYRVKITCTEGEFLMSGLKVTIGDKTVTGFASYISAWEPLAPKTDMTPVKVSIELPEEAGNEFQNQTAKIDVLLEAIQGNAETVDEANTGITVVAATEADLAKAVQKGMNVVLANDITLNKTLMTTKDVAIDLNGCTVEANTSGALFQTQSNAAPSLTITSSKSGAKINAGNQRVLLGYGDSAFYNVEINLENASSSANNPFNVYGSLILGEGTVVNVETLGTSLISGGPDAIVIDGAEINVGTFSVIGGGVIACNASTVLEIKNTVVNVGLDATKTSYFVTRADNATIEGCTFNVTDADGASYDIVLKPDANVGARYAWVKK